VLHRLALRVSESSFGTSEDHHSVILSVLEPSALTSAEEDRPAGSPSSRRVILAHHSRVLHWLPVQRCFPFANPVHRSWQMARSSEPYPSGLLSFDCVNGDNERYPGDAVPILCR